MWKQLSVCQQLDNKMRYTETKIEILFTLEKEGNPVISNSMDEC